MSKQYFQADKNIEVLENNIVRYNYFAKTGCINNKPSASTVDTFCLRNKINEICSTTNQPSPADIFYADKANIWIHTGGWQSWGPGFEIAPDEKRPLLKNRFIPQFTNYIRFPGTSRKYDNIKYLQTQFISYLRLDDTYFVMASTGCVNDRNPVQNSAVKKPSVTAPVQFIINRKNLDITVQVHDSGRYWNQNEVICQVCFFICSSYSELQNNIEYLFGSSDKKSINYSKRFDSLEFLGNRPCGWESWYNHYSHIDQKLIEDDLETLCSTENLISISALAEKKPCIFQIDDGWEEALGDWKWRKDRFPEGPQYLTEKISKKGLVPGLWIAPFAVDLRSSLATLHPDWLLRNKNGKPVTAGFNPLWGAKFGKKQPSLPHSFFCLDLGNCEVLDYLDKLMDTAINEWGFRYLKLDFLYAGMLNGEHKEKNASFVYYDKAVKILTRRKTNSKGEEVSYLGCGMPFEHSFNDFPLSRSGCDTLEHWDDDFSAKMKWWGRTSAYLNMKNSIGKEFWNRRIYWCDPDVIFIRNENCSLTKDEKLLIAAVASMSANQLMYSDDPASSCSEDEISLAKEIISNDKFLYGKKYSVKPLIRDVFEVRSEQSVKILNLKRQDIILDGKTVKAHSFTEI